jgi:PAS domain S-box-containing protein
VSDLADERIAGGLADELLATRERLEVVLGNIAEGVTITEREGRFLYANAAAARILGFDSTEELLTIPSYEVRERFALYRPDGSPMPPDELPGRRAFAGEAPEEVVLRFRPSGGGSERVSVVRAVPVFDETGDVRYVVNFFREVTDERRRAARDAFIAQAGGLLGMTLDYETTLGAVAALAVPQLADVCAVDLVDDAGALRRVAAAYADPDDEALARRLHDLQPPTLGDVHGPGLVIRTGQRDVVDLVSDRDLVASARDAHQLELLRTISPRAFVSVPIEARGRVLGAVTFGSLTEHRTFDHDDVELAVELARRAGIAIDNARLFRETERSEALLDTLFASAPVGLGFWDRELRFVRLNDALAEINGLPAEDHVGRTITDVLPDLDPAVFDYYRRVVETGEPLRDLEVQGETPSRPGIRRTWLTSYYPIHDAAGTVIGVGAVVTEMTDRRRAERRLRVQHAVTAILAEAETLDEALPRVLQEIADVLEWDFGAYWPVFPDAPDLGCLFVHAQPGLESFAAATMRHRVRPGVSLAGEIWKSRAPRWIADLADRADFPHAAEAAALGIRTGFGFPAIVAGEVVAVVEFFSRAQREPDEELLHLVATLGRNIGQFVQRKRAEQERARLLVAEQQARAEAEAAAQTLRKLGQVTEAALEHLSLRDLLNALLGRLVEVLNADSAAILLLDEAGRNLSVRASVGLERELELSVPVPLGQGLAGRVAATRTSLLVDDLDEVELVSPVLRARGIKSLVAIPLVVEEKAIGVMHAASEQRGQFTHDDARLMELIADRIALAINQATLYEAEQVAQERLSMLAEASTLLAASLDYEEGLASFARLAVPRLADVCLVDMLEEGDEIRRIAVAHVDGGQSAQAWKLGERYPASLDDPSGELLGHVLRTGAPVLVEKALVREGELPHGVLDLGAHSCMIVPLVARGRTLGAITFAWAESANEYGPGDLRFARDLAARAAVAVDNARLFRTAEEGRERLGFLAEASRLLASALDAETALDRFGALVVRRVADWCAIHLSDERGRPRLVTVGHRDPERAAWATAYLKTQEPWRGAECAVLEVVRTGEPQLIETIPPEILNASADETGIHSALIVPLRARGRTLGALTLVWAETPRSYAAADVEFAQDLARRVGVAVDNAQLYREAAERAQAARVLASVGDGVVLVDGAGIARYWNRAAAAMIGLAPVEVLDRPLAEVIPGWITVADRAPVAAIGATSPRPESLPLVLGDRELWLSVAGVEVADGVVYAFRDLTEDRALDELKTEFVSTVSHELRTPLAAIYGAAMTLRRSDIELEQPHRENLLAVISNEADRLARTVNDILWASRLDTDTLRVAIESCDPLPLAHDVVAAQRTHLPEGIDIKVEAEDDLPAVAADPDKVRQVLANLVDNAVKYSPDGGRIEVRVAPAGAHVRFSVIDEGLGIPYAEQRRIFEKFYRVDPNMTRGISGTGLGLYICRELVRRMNGRLAVDSEPGKGSTFTFELPIAGTEDVAAHIGTNSDDKNPSA